MADPIYVPGWIVNGLPIEWKIEEQYKKKKTKMKFRLKILRVCRDFAKKGLTYILKNL